MARTSTSGTTRTTFMGRSISPLMCCAIRLANSTSTRPSLVLLLFDRPEDFRKGLFFGVTEILLLVLGIHSDEVYCVRSGEVVRSPARHRVSHLRDAPTAPSAYRFRPECAGGAPGRRQCGAPFRPVPSRRVILRHHVDSAGTGTSGAYLNCTAAMPQLQLGGRLVANLPHVPQFTWRDAKMRPSPFAPAWFPRLAHGTPRELVNFYG